VLLSCGGKLADFMKQAICNFLQGKKKKKKKKAYVTFQNENVILCVQQDMQQ